MRRRVLLLFMIMLLVSPIYANPTFRIGSTPPDFVLNNLSGNSINLNNYLGKNVIILSFFASWSDSCQTELAFLQQLQNEFKENGVKVIGISFDKKNYELSDLLAKMRISFEIVRDKKLKTLKDYKILILPTLVIINKEGIATASYTDFDDNVKEAVLKEISNILNPPEST